MEGVEMQHKNKAPIEFQVRIVIEPDGDSFHAYCPALKGLHTCGDTEEEAVSNAEYATRAYLRSLIEHGDPIPVGILSSYGENAIMDTLEKRESCHIRDLVVADA